MSKIAVIKDIKHSVSWIGEHNSRLTPGQLVEIYREGNEMCAVYSTIGEYDRKFGWLVPPDSVEIIGEL